MADGPNISPGEVGGIFAGAVAMLVALGGGIKWLMSWRADRRDSFHAKLIAWEARLLDREKQLDVERDEHFARIETRLKRMEEEQAVLLKAYHLVAGGLRTLDSGNAALRMADDLLRAAFPIDPVTPPDMSATVAKLD